MGTGGEGPVQEHMGSQPPCSFFRKCDTGGDPDGRGLPESGPNSCRGRGGAGGPGTVVVTHQHHGVRTHPGLHWMLRVSRAVGPSDRTFQHPVLTGDDGTLGGGRVRPPPTSPHWTSVLFSAPTSRRTHNRNSQPISAGSTGSEEMEGEPGPSSEPTSLQTSWAPPGPYTGTNSVTKGERGLPDRRGGTPHKGTRSGLLGTDKRVPLLSYRKGKETYLHG